MATKRRVFAKPAVYQPDGVAYEPFPAEGEDVYTTHPAFVYDGALKVALDGFHLTLAMMFWKTKILKPEMELEGKMTTAKAWLAGEIPIPAARWDEFKQARVRWLTRRSLPLDSPIGFQHPDFPRG